MKVSHLILYSAILFAAHTTQATADELPISILKYVEQAMSQSNDALAIADLEAISDLDLNSQLLNYDFQWTPSLSLSNSPFGRSQSMGIIGTKKFEFGTEVRLKTNYEQYESNVTNNVSKSPSVEISIEQELFRNFGRESGRHQLNVAELQKKLSYLQTIERRQNLIKRALSVYFNTYLVENKLQLTKLGLVRGEETLAITRSRFNMGLVSKLDLYRAEREYLTLTNKYNQLQQQLISQQADLKIFINWRSTKTLVLQKVDTFKASFDNVELTQAYLNRPDWRRQTVIHQIKKLELKKAKRDLLPDVKLRLGAKKYYDFFENELGYQNDETDWNVGLQYSTSLDMTKEQNRYDRMQILYKQFVREQDRIQQTITASIVQSVQNVKHLAQASELNEQILQQSELAVDLATLRFQKGLSSNLELVEAETQYQQNQLALLDGQISYNLALVELAQHLGILDIKWLEQAVPQHD